MWYLGPKFAHVFKFCDSDSSWYQICWIIICFVYTYFYLILISEFVVCFFFSIWFFVSFMYLTLFLANVLFILFTNPSARAGYDTRSTFKRSLTGFNSEFSFSYTSCLTKAEEPSLSYYLPIAGGRIIGFIPFPRVLVLCEMQSVSSRIWTRVAVFISYDDNNYTT